MGCCLGRKRVECGRNLERIVAKLIEHGHNVGGRSIVAASVMYGPDKSEGVEFSLRGVAPCLRYHEVKIFDNSGATTSEMRTLAT